MTQAMMMGTLQASLSVEPKKEDVHKCESIDEEESSEEEEEEKELEDYGDSDNENKLQMQMKTMMTQAMLTWHHRVDLVEEKSKITTSY